MEVSKRLPTEAVEDYLREVYVLEVEGSAAKASRVAERMEVAPASAAAMMKKLATLQLVEHTPYRGVALTDAGRRIALEVVRHHRLIEQYLAEVLGVPLEAVHDEADRLEHVLPDELEARIDASLGFPTHDPHGDPIPDRELKVDDASAVRLDAVAEGEERTVTRVPNRDPELLRYLIELSLVPGSRLTVRTVAPFGGPITLAVEGVAGDRAISRELAALIDVA